MRILILTTHLDKGGVSFYALNLARILKSSGIYAAVASGGGELEEELRKAGIDHYPLDIRTKSEFGIKMWKALPVLKRLVVKEGFDLIHAQTRVAQVLAELCGKSLSIPFISTCHGFFRHRKLSRRLFPCWGKKVIAVSKSVEKHLVSDFYVPSGDVEQIYNGIGLDRFLFLPPGKDAEAAERVGINSDALVVGAVGRLSPVKGYEYLVEAFKGFSETEKRSVLLLVGDGPEKFKLSRQIQKLGITDRVRMVPGSLALEKYMSLIDIFCMPSIHEGLGLSLMEAMASRRSCVASDVGGLSELIVSGEDGILVPVKNAAALGEAIKALAYDPGLREKLARNAREKAGRAFSIEDSVRRTVEVYERVLRKS
ncbi:MAG: glycosyltransferase family 4 protein [Candidatus Omnitrophota bacterium]